MLKLILHGAHKIVHVGKNKRLRVAHIEPIYNKKGYASKLTTRPATAAEKEKYTAKIEA